MEEEIRILQQQVNELMEWRRERETQQLSFPVDNASKAALQAATFRGTGVPAAKDDISLTGAPQTISVPANPSSTLLLELDGSEYEVLVK